MKLRSAVALALILSATLSACGGSSDINDGTSDADTGGSNDPGSFDDPSDTGSNNQSPPLGFSFTIGGPEGDKPKYTTPKFSTDSLLKVGVSFDSANLTSQTGYQVALGCARVRVTLGTINDGKFKSNGAGITTEIMSVPYAYSGICWGAPTEQVIDLSNHIAGGKDIAIRLDNAMYDYYCQLWYTLGAVVMGPYANNCPVRPVYQNHLIHGSLAVQVNGTTPP